MYSSRVTTMKASGREIHYHDWHRLATWASHTSRITFEPREEFCKVFSPLYCKEACSKTAEQQLLDLFCWIWSATFANKHASVGTSQYQYDSWLTKSIIQSHSLIRLHIDTLILKFYKIAVIWLEKCGIGCQSRRFTHIGSTHWFWLWWAISVQQLCQKLLLEVKVSTCSAFASRSSGMMKLSVYSPFDSRSNLTWKICLRFSGLAAEKTSCSACNS